MSRRDVRHFMTRWSLDEIRRGQLWPIILALALIIASLFALLALAGRMQQVVVKQGVDALTADAVYVSANPIADSLQHAVTESKVSHAFMTRYATMAFSASGEMQLVTVRAVDSHYPLRGHLLLSGPQGQQHHVRPGEIWLEPRIMQQLNIASGESISIGDADFIVSGKVISEPGISFNPFSQMPAVYIHQQDIDKTGAIQTGSRVEYQLFINGDAATLASLRAASTLTPSDRWRMPDKETRSSDIFLRTQQYLSLTVAVVILMAAITLVLTCQHYVNSRRQTVAMLRSLGASKGWIVRWLSRQILLLFVVAALFGIAAGAVFEFMLRQPIRDLLPAPLPGYGWSPLLMALGIAASICVPAMGIPLHRLINTPAVSVMQNPGRARRYNHDWWLICIPLIPLAIAYYDNPLVWIILVALIGLFVVLGGISLLLARLLGVMSHRPAFALALSRINRSLWASGLQFAALGLSLMLLAVIVMVRADVVDNWRALMPKAGPNVFAYNISESEKAAYLQTLDAEHIQRSAAYPIIRGRLDKINGVPARQHTPKAAHNNALHRELNFTWMKQLPAYNQVVAGQWHNSQGVSVEVTLAQELGIHIGDKLTFVIGGESYQATVNTLRQVEWRDMQPNFFFIFSSDVLANMPGSYLLSFRIDTQDSALLASLARQHPTVSLIDIRRLGAKIQHLLGQVISTISLLSLLALAAGLLLIFTLLRLSMTQRSEEIRLYRTLGASKGRIRATLWAEYGVIAIIASLVACGASELCVAALMYWGFNLNPQFHFYLWLWLPLASIIVLGCVVFSMINRLLTPVSKGSLSL